MLNLKNPLELKDPIFGLLGNPKASEALGKFQGGPDCLQQAVADQAFTNAKDSRDIEGMTAALIYRALERNTVKVGLASVLCSSTAINKEIAAISQHQDPASPDAGSKNKAIVLALAKQIKAIGGNPLDALKSGTFAPGKTNDPTAKGNSCDTPDDKIGCIFTQNKLVKDATDAEVLAAAK